VPKRADYSSARIIDKSGTSFDVRAPLTHNWSVGGVCNLSDSLLYICPAVGYDVKVISIERPLVNDELVCATDCQVLAAARQRLC